MAKKMIPRPRHFDTTIPKIQTCQRCAAWLAAGIAEGIHVKVDLTALDPVQAALATLVRTRLFAMTRTGLVELDELRIADPKFGRPFPAHRCGTVWESRLPAAGPIAPRYDETRIPY